MSVHELVTAGEYEKAISLMESMRGQTVDSLEIVSYSKALEQTGNRNDAIDVLRRLFYGHPYSEHAKAYAGSMARLGHRDREALQQMIDLYPADPFFKAAKAEVALIDGDYETGFSLCRHRFSIPDALCMHGKIDLPEWGGGRLDGPLLVVAEQGLGEEILFASRFGLIPPAIISCNPRLIPLFQRSFPQHTFVKPEQLLSHCGAAYIHAMDLMRLTDATSNSAPWLIADAGKTAHIAREVSAALPGRKVYGLSWWSSRKHLGDAKSIPLANVADLLASGEAFFSLQYGDVLGHIHELMAMGRRLYSIDGIDNTQDLDGVASVIMAMDAVVTCSNTVAHLAGALGKRTILLAPDRFSLWYWLKNGDCTPWYPSVEILRNTNGWDELIQRAIQSMRER